MGNVLPAAAILFAAFRVAPDARSPAPLTLDEAISIARAASPGLGAASRRANAAEEQARAAGRFWIPDLSLDSTWDRTELPSRVFAQKLNRGSFASSDFAIERLNAPGFDSNLESTLGLNVPLDVFGSLRAGARAADGGAKSEAARARAAQGDLTLEVIRVYFGILSADRTSDAAAKSLEASAELERAVQQRRDSGAALDADLLRVRSRRRGREVELAKARNDAALGRSRLRALLGWSPDRAIEISAPPEEDRDPEPLDRWIAAALSHSPELETASAATRASRESYRRERLAALPAVRIFGGYQDERNSFSAGKGSATVEVRLHWTLWDAGRSSRTAAALEGARASDEMRKGAEDAVRLEVETRWRDLDLARTEAGAAVAGRREADEVYRVTRERWEAGKAALVDLLDAESAAAGAAAAEANAAARIRIARAALQRAAGEM